MHRITIKVRLDYGLNTDKRMNVIQTESRNSSENNLPEIWKSRIKTNKKYLKKKNSLETLEIRDSIEEAKHHHQIYN